MALKFAIGIPARFGSTRFPGKPLALINGKTMLQRVVEIARQAAKGYPDVMVFVTTEDVRIAEHAEEIGVECIKTTARCETGSDRVLAAIRQLEDWPSFILNLQGDAPFTPPSLIKKIFDRFEENPKAEVITPVHKLSWEDLDRLRQLKQTTPYSGTTAIINEDGKALWFSKSIIPAIRGEAELRSQGGFSPVYQHIGLYGYRADILEQFCNLPQGTYEKLEGLEQLRMLENNIAIEAVETDIEDGAVIQSGIDSPEDIQRAEEHIRLHGEVLS